MFQGFPSLKGGFLANLVMCAKQPKAKTHHGYIYSDAQSVMIARLALT